MSGSTSIPYASAPPPIADKGSVSHESAQTLYDKMRAMDKRIDGLERDREHCIAELTSTVLTANKEYEERAKLAAELDRIAPRDWLPVDVAPLSAANPPSQYTYAPRFERKPPFTPGSYVNWSYEGSAAEKRMRDTDGEALAGRTDVDAYAQKVRDLTSYAPNPYRRVSGHLSDCAVNHAVSHDPVSCTCHMRYLDI